MNLACAGFYALHRRLVRPVSIRKKISPFDFSSHDIDVGLTDFKNDQIKTKKKAEEEKGEKLIYRFECFAQFCTYSAKSLPLLNNKQKC